MFKVSQKQFEKVVAEAIDNIAPTYQKHLSNVAFIVEGEANAKQRQQLGLADGDLLFGLYEGVPLPARGGGVKLLPDKITIFKKPLEQVSRDLVDLQDRVGRTVWHEVAHYYGLSHDRMYKLEAKK